MAMSGNYINQFKTGHALYVEWSAANKTPTNKSDVTFSVYARLSTGYSIDIGTRAGQVSAGGITKDFTGVAVKATSGDRLLATVVVEDIPHNDDGSLSIALSTTFAFNMTISGIYYGSYTATPIPPNMTALDTIPRASLLSSFNDFQIETTAGAIAGNANVYSATFYHRFKLFQGSTEVASWDIGQLTVGAYAYALSLTATQRNAIFAAMPTIDNQLFTLQLITYNDAARTVQIGSTQTKTATGTIPVSYKPTLTTSNSNYSWTNKNSKLTSYLIQNISTLTLLLSGGAPPTGATLTDYQVRFGTIIRAGSYTGSAISENVGLILGNGSMTAYYSVKDSRGRWSNEIAETFTVQAYDPPINNGFDVRRNVTTPTSADYILKFSNSLYSLGNTWTYTLYYWNVSTWTVAKVATAIASASIDTIYTHALPYSESVVYSVIAVLVDLFNEADYTDTLPTSAFPASFGKKGMGIGRDTSDTYNLEVGELGISSDGPIYMNGEKVLTAESLLQISCRTYPTINQSIPNGSPAVLEFAGELFDTASIHNPTYPTNMTAPVAGIYLITAVVKFVSNSAGARKASLILNGSAEIASSASQAGIESAVSISTVYQLAANDVVQVYAYQTSGGALNTDSAGVGMSFSMTKIA